MQRNKKQTQAEDQCSAEHELTGEHEALVRNEMKNQGQKPQAQCMIEQVLHARAPYFQLPRGQLQGFSQVMGAESTG